MSEILSRCKDYGIRMYAVTRYFPAIVERCTRNATNNNKFLCYFLRCILSGTMFVLGGLLFFCVLVLCFCSFMRDILKGSQ